MTSENLEKVVIEIRDMMRRREKSGWASLMWMTFSVFAGVYFAAILLKFQGYL